MRLDKLRVAMVAAALVGFAAAVAGLDMYASRGGRLTGDEPHYVLTAISIAEDADLNVADEYAAFRYQLFHARRLDPQGIENGRRIVEPHDPLLPAMLALPVRAGGWQGAKIALAAINAILAAALVH